MTSDDVKVLREKNRPILFWLAVLFIVPTFLAVNRAGYDFGLWTAERFLSSAPLNLTLLYLLAYRCFPSLRRGASS